MKIKLQPSVLLSFVILVALFFLKGTGEVFGQIPIESDKELTVIFHEGALPPAGQEAHYFSVQDFSGYLSESLHPSVGEREGPDTIMEVREGNFTRISELNNVSDTPVTGFSIRNQTDDDFDELELTFDFYTLGELPASASYLRLIYRKNEGIWADVSGGRLSVSSFQSAGEESEVSVQLNFDELFISPGDVLDFVWVADSVTPQEIPLYLRQIKMRPELFSSSVLSKGDLIITEIMPHSDADGQRLEYLEIYNPSEEARSLKGLRIETDTASLILEKEFNLPGYQIAVIANADLSELEQIRHSYHYPDAILPEDNGRVQLVLGDSLIASVTYGTTENNRALELVEAGYASDGLTRLQHLEISSRNFFGPYWGSPGEFGRTLPLFRKEYSEPGVYLLSVPGKLKNPESMLRDLQFFTLDGVKITHSDILPYEPVIMMKEQSEPVVLAADGINLATHQTDIFTAEHGNFKFLIPLYPGLSRLGDNIAEHRENFPPLFGEWNSRLQKFDLLTPSEIAKRDNWSPLVTANSNTTSGLQERSLQNENHLWIFSVTEPDDRRSGDFDGVVIGFTEQNPFTFGVPKPALRKQSDRNQKIYPSLYVSSSEAGVRANSFIQMGTRLSEKKEIVIGVDNRDLNSQLQAELRWNLPDIIPEEWTLTLTDPSTGIEIDMRQQNRYRFRVHPPRTPSDRENSPVQFHQVTPEEASEFIITLSPAMMTSQNKSEQEIPGEIELRQNYPNPFNPTTNITFFLPEERPVRLGIYNIVGQQVASLIEDHLLAGEHSVTWDASNNPSGIYIVQLESGSRTLTRKITLVK